MFRFARFRSCWPATACLNGSTCCRWTSGENVCVLKRPRGGGKLRSHIGVHRAFLDLANFRLEDLAARGRYACATK